MRRRLDRTVRRSSRMLPLLAYALFGTSRQLVVGPDAATCALIAASAVPLAGGDPALYLSVSMALALIAGCLCIAASFLRLGALADFLSRPILICVVLAVLRLVKFAARPRVERLGTLKGQPGFHTTDYDPAVATLPGLVLWRFNSPLVFFNAPYFKREAIKAMDTAGPVLRWFVLDILPIARRT